MRDIDFERRFDLGTNRDLRRLAPNLRVDRRSIRELNDRQTLAKLLKSKEFEYLKKLELKKTNEDIIKRLVEEQKIKRVAGARRRGSLRKSRQQQIRETQAYERGERREAGEEEVRVRGTQQERQNLQQLQNEILTIRQALNNENMNIRQQLLQQQQNQVQRDAYLLQYLGGFNPNGQDVIRAVRNPQAPIRLPDRQASPPRAAQLAQAAGVLPPAQADRARAAAARARVRLAAPAARVSPIPESPRPRRKRTLEELEDNELTDLFVANENDPDLIKRILDEIQKRNQAELRRVDEGAGAGLEAGLSLELEPGAETEQEAFDRLVREEQEQDTLSPPSRERLRAVVAEENPEQKLSKARKLIDALSPRRRGPRATTLPPISGAEEQELDKTDSDPITAFEKEKIEKQERASIRRLKSLGEKFTRRKTREDTPAPPDEDFEVEVYGAALEAIQEEEDDRVVVEKIHKAASEERGRLEQARKAAAQLQASRGEEQEQIDKQARLARTAQGRRRFEPTKGKAQAFGEEQIVEDPFPPTLPADTSGINLLQKSIELSGGKPLELSSVLASDVVAQAQRLQEEGKLSQIEQQSQEQIDIAEEKIQLERLQEAIEQDRNKEQSLKFTLKAQELRDDPVLKPSKEYLESLERVEAAQEELAAASPVGRPLPKQPAPEQPPAPTELVRARAESPVFKVDNPLAAVEDEPEAQEEVIDLTEEPVAEEPEEESPQRIPRPKRPLDKNTKKGQRIKYFDRDGNYKPGTIVQVDRTPIEPGNPARGFDVDYQVKLDDGTERGADQKRLTRIPELAELYDDFKGSLRKQRFAVGKDAKTDLDFRRQYVLRNTGLQQLPEGGTRPPPVGFDKVPFGIGPGDESIIAGLDSGREGVETIRHYHKKQKFKAGTGATGHINKEDSRHYVAPEAIQRRKDRGDLKETDYSTRTNFKILKTAIDNGHLELVELDEPVVLEDYLLNNDVYRAHRDIGEQGELD